MTIDRCPLCGKEVRLETHHITGRVRGKPIHPRFVVSICGRCNRQMFLVWKEVGIDGEKPTVATLLRRLAVFLSTWPGALDLSLTRVLADVLVDLAEKLEAAP